jgi:ATP-dependent DNA helicase RecQ
VPTLESFAFGDTPTAGALRGLLGELLGAGRHFDVALHSLSTRHDIRQLVLRTALTYLELLGVLRQGTPFYAGYRARPIEPVPRIVARFPGQRGEFLRRLFEAAKLGREWYTIDPESVAASLGEPRDRVVGALDYLAEQGWIELRVADARQTYTRLDQDADGDALAAELASRFERRERAEVDRIQRVLDLVTHEGCQTNLLLEYFGERRDGPCGHCGFCEDGAAGVLPPLPVRAPIEASFDVAAFTALVRDHPAALGEPRQRARFLCGLSSPAVSRARLGRDPLFGALEGRHFLEVLRWCEG